MHIIIPPVPVMAQFFTIVVMPQYQAFCTAFPDCSAMLKSLKDNYAM